MEIVTKGGCVLGDMRSGFGRLKVRLAAVFPDYASAVLEG